MLLIKEKHKIKCCHLLSLCLASAHVYSVFLSNITSYIYVISRKGAKQKVERISHSTSSIQDFSDFQAVEWCIGNSPKLTLQRQGKSKRRLKKKRKFHVLEL